MANRINSLRQSARDAAYRAGLPRFWRWWTAELAALTPASTRSSIRRRLTRPVIEFGDGEAVFWLPQIVDGALGMVAIARVPLLGEANDIAAAGRAAVAALAREGQGDARVAPNVVVALPQRQVLRKEIILPAAVGEDLQQALSYDLDRHTPFRPEQLYFDAAVIDRDLAGRTIRVDWVAALKSAVDATRRQVEEWGATVAAVVPGPASTSPTRINLLPEGARSRRRAWRRWQLWAPAGLIAAIALAALFVPLLQKREYAIALNLQMETARQQAEAADAIRVQLERAQSDYNYVLAKKYAYPSAVQMLDEVTKLLPDDTWISALEVKSTARGKETQREMLLRGESANAGKLISLLEDSKLVEQAAMRSPTTKLQPGPGEVFDLGSQLRMLTPSAALQTASASPPAAAANGSQATVPSAPAPAVSTPPAGPSTPSATPAAASTPGGAATTPPGATTPQVPAALPSPGTPNAALPTPGASGSPAASSAGPASGSAPAPMPTRQGNPS
ncbi:MAG: hypothetical protein E6H74_02285 [Betaproteobacteria bacterium]|nr:MAG: hypothetical protein E6H74_02285 [Betaproteobacteria bacterium]